MTEWASTPIVRDQVRSVVRRVALLAPAVEASVHQLLELFECRRKGLAPLAKSVRSANPSLVLARAGGADRSRRIPFQTKVASRPPV